MSAFEKQRVSIVVSWDSPSTCDASEDLEDVLASAETIAPA